MHPSPVFPLYSNHISFDVPSPTRAMKCHHQYTLNFYLFPHHLTACLTEPCSESLLQDSTREEMSKLSRTFPSSLISAASHTFSKTSLFLGFKLRMNLPRAREILRFPSVPDSLLNGPQTCTNLEHKYCQTRSEQSSIISSALPVTDETQRASKEH